MRKKRTKICFVLIALIGISIGCSNKDKKVYTPIDSKPLYAKGFSFSKYNNFDVININDPWDSLANPTRVVLYHDAENIGHLPEGYKKLQIPVKNVITLSGTQIAFFNKLDNIEVVCGIDNINYVTDSVLKVSLGDIVEVGEPGNFSVEQMLSVSPDIVMVSPFKNQNFNTLEETGIFIFPFADYLETHPLGRTEWIKVIGALLDKKNAADSIFIETMNNYNTLLQQAASTTARPTIVSSKPFGGIWYMPGGGSYMAKLFTDAGAKYMLQDDDHVGSVSLDFEAVYAKGSEADYWRLLVMDNDKYTYEKLQQEDERYTDFKAFKEKKVFVCNASKVAYYNMGAIEPDIILSDLIKIFHPELLDNYTPKYYKLLK